MRTSALFGAKTSDFWNGVRTDKWVSQCGHFLDKREGVNFRDFVWTSFMTATNYLHKKSLAIYETLKSDFRNLRFIINIK